MTGTYPLCNGRSHPHDFGKDPVPHVLSPGGTLQPRTEVGVEVEKDVDEAD